MNGEELVDPMWAAGFRLLEQAIDAGLVNTEEEARVFGAQMGMGLVTHTGSSGPSPAMVAAVEEHIVRNTEEPEPPKLTDQLWVP